ncbi:transcription factor MYB35-like isoform X4 [Silene latifolia]|uniref:transcription factor MYB35-like isoform X4 n=1 Tax=Silene latifolia TaxID=37657 RepID=UPI003D7786EB
MVRPPCNDKTNYKKRGWREEDDAKILHYVSSTHGKQESSSGLKRCGKSCKGKWSNEGFSQHEEELIIKLHAAVGSRWAIIAHQLPGRSDNDIKIHWNTKLKKKLTERGIDPVTHKPFSQILADYGKIGQVVKSPPESFSWHEFLLDEAINKPVQDQEQEQEQEFDDIRFFNSLQSCRMPEIGNVEFNGDQFQGVPSTSMSSQGSTFLEAMLDQETDMFLNFPGLMEEPLY